MEPSIAYHQLTSFYIPYLFLHHCPHKHNKPTVDAAASISADCKSIKTLFPFETTPKRRRERRLFQQAKCHLQVLCSSSATPMVVVVRKEKNSSTEAKEEMRNRFSQKFFGSTAATENNNNNNPKHHQTEEGSEDWVLKEGISFSNFLIEEIKNRNKKQKWDQASSSTFRISKESLLQLFLPLQEEKKNKEKEIINESKKMDPSPPRPSGSDRSTAYVGPTSSTSIGDNRGSSSDILYVMVAQEDIEIVCRVVNCLLSTEDDDDGDCEGSIQEEAKEKRQASCRPKKYVIHVRQSISASIPAGGGTKNKASSSLLSISDEESKNASSSSGLLLLEHPVVKCTVLPSSITTSKDKSTVAERQEEGIQPEETDKEKMDSNSRENKDTSTSETKNEQSRRSLTKGGEASANKLTATHHNSSALGSSNGSTSRVEDQVMKDIQQMISGLKTGALEMNSILKLEEKVMDESSNLLEKNLNSVEQQSKKVSKDLLGGNSRGGGGGGVWGFLKLSVSSPKEVLLLLIHFIWRVLKPVLSLVAVGGLSVMTCYVIIFVGKR